LVWYEFRFEGVGSAAVVLVLSPDGAGAPLDDDELLVVCTLGPQPLAVTSAARYHFSSPSLDACDTAWGLRIHCGERAVAAVLHG